MIDGWAMAKFDAEKSSIAYSVKYGSKYVNVFTDWGRPSAFDGHFIQIIVNKIHCIFRFWAV